MENEHTLNGPNWKKTRENERVSEHEHKKNQHKKVEEEEAEVCVSFIDWIFGVARALAEKNIEE